MQISNPTIPLGSTVVVIGANGYMGVETCEKLLQAGFHVRGTVRNVEKNRPWMHALFDEKWPGNFELIAVPNFEADGAFDQAFAGAAGVIYVSTPVIFDADPAKVINPVVKGTINTLNAAARARVKRYVLSSSSKAVESTVYNKLHHITSTMFNYEAIRKTCCDSTTEGFERQLNVYSASRTLAELAFWSWVGENQSPFVANCVVPDGQFGRVLNTDHIASTGVMLKNAIEGNWDGVFPQLAYYCDVQDTARLLVAALALPTLSNERIFAYSYNGTWNELRQKVSRIRAGSGTDTIVKGKDQELAGRDLSDASGPIRRAEEILRQVGRPGFSSDESILRDWLESFY
ncbi:hypothetical protein NM208_g5399 [Fusarium decemcellulare]|uniref:Uncharacterized protein n=1 Tax=Fusarium decemcellulare TaxID=57161 RepID=A0ACC1SH44_9HYPO|nr:hypothetical protein NM208_g5399 [Fusarium decemcellulare]